MNTPTQSEGEDRDTVIGAVFALMLERKSKEYPDLTTFLRRIGMSLGSYYNLLKGVGNPTFWTVERTAQALGLTAWEMLGIDQKVVKAWLAGENIDVEKIQHRVQERRQSRQRFSLDEFSVNEADSTSGKKAFVEAAAPSEEEQKPAASPPAKSRAVAGNRREAVGATRSPAGRKGRTVRKA
ncbi:hypothetical protein IY145_23545 [Methylosinus sp. H3A]|uniref:hypothetical protein n=1 Tax=Methylosinus sp. H3A TaxID=2785786 RepID=UPI0018C2720B|nr:hypothetical protein [Methylosinus sp. H3A]MBG0812324.1 hypothetical protein [Methylosinus sp. H3A]